MMLSKKLGFDYSYIGAVNNYNNCRLFLSSVYELPNEQKSDRKYMFSYITPEKLPAKTTTLIDYWGFAKDHITIMLLLVYYLSKKGIGQNQGL